jgi:hypothetical protein
MWPGLSLISHWWAGRRLGPADDLPVGQGRRLPGPLAHRLNRRRRRRGPEACPSRPVAAASRQLERLGPVATGRRPCGTADGSRRRATRARARHRHAAAAASARCFGPAILSLQFFVGPLRAGNSFPNQMMERIWEKERHFGRPGKGDFNL